MKSLSFTLFILLIINFSCSQSPADMENEQIGPRKVEMKQNSQGFYRLFVDGEEFYVKGAGLEFGNRQALAAHGANSFRTWRTDNAQAVLDEAEELGLMVLMGIEVGRERHGFDYDDEAWVANQKEEIKQQVLEFKDHPALLGWGIGNELNLRYTNKKVWNAVNDISKMIHEIDGNHVTTTMLAGIWADEIEYMNEHCTDIDFLSIQMYGDIINAQKRIADAGYSGPYMVTEWGATGHWEVPKTNWGAPIEQSSKEKAEVIKERYQKSILSDKENCLGSYVFLWGQKQERTPTWYGLFTEDGEEMGAIDEMHYFWNDNTYPENRAPEISNIKLNGKTAVQSVTVRSKSEVTLTYEASDPDGDPLTKRVEVMHEATVLGDGGDPEPRPATVKDLLLDDADGSIKFRAPADSGAYRIFLYLLDGHNNVATVNIPFLVKN